jgi:predicted Zn-dependent protease
MDPNTPEYHDTLGGVLVRQNKFQDAAAEWRAYLKQVPDNPGVLNDLAWILATELNAAGEAETLARKAVGIAPQDPQYRDTLAESLARQGKTAEAARVAREALALEGASPDLRRFLSSGSR